MITNPYMSTVILHGGPKDKEMLVLSRSITEHGYLQVAIPPDPACLYQREATDTVFSTINMKIGMYKRVKHAEGDPKTCEYREWYEWHWMGEK